MDYTEAELLAVTAAMFDESWSRHSHGYSADDIVAVAATHAAQILSALAKSDYAKVGWIFQAEKADAVNQRCEIELYGRVIDHTVVQKAAKQPRFAATYCSQCGAATGPGDAGFSKCIEHLGRPIFRGLAA